MPVPLGTAGAASAGIESAPGTTDAAGSAWSGAGTIDADEVAIGGGATLA
jgi:hypothetical protein